MNARLQCLSVLACLLAACVQSAPLAFARDGAPAAMDWPGTGAGLRGANDLEALKRLEQDYPSSRNVRLALANAYLDAGRSTEAFGEILRLVDGGYSFSENGQRALLGLFDGVERERLAAAFAREDAPLVASEGIASVPAGVLLVESVALDRRTGRMFAGSIVSQGLFAREPGSGEWKRLPIEKSGSIGGLAVDETQRILWAASGVYDETPRPEGAFSGLVGIPLDGGTERRLAAPDGATPSDILLGADGTLYAADPVRGAIYRALPGEASLSVWVEPGTFRSPQGMAEAGGGILVSDWGYGLALVDKATGKAWRVDPDVPVLLDGIDGMWRHGDEIVAVQNGARPAQIVAFALSPDGRRVSRWRVIERDVPGWTEPASGSLSGDDLLYVGNGQWDRFGKDGAVREGKQPGPTEIRRLELAKKPFAKAKKPG